MVDWNVSTDTFERVLSLEVFSAEGPNTSVLNCIDGEWEAAHGISLCVSSGIGSGSEASTAGVAKPSPGS